MIAALLRDVVARQEAAQNSEQINREVKNLIALAENQPSIVVTGADDGWTSRPLNISFLDLKSVGLIPGREGENEFILLKIIQDFQADPRIGVVDRSMMDALIRELQLSSSDLVNKATQLKVGRILSARLIANGSIIRDRESVQVTMMVVETETTEYKVTLAELMDKRLNPAEIADRISQILLTEIKRQFPLRGLITKVDGKQVTLNIGSSMGLEKDMKLNLVDPRLSGGQRVLGSVKVTDVGENEATAAVIDAKVKVYQGMKVEEQ